LLRGNSLAFHTDPLSLVSKLSKSIFAQNGTVQSSWVALCTEQHMVHAARFSINQRLSIVQFSLSQNALLSFVVWNWQLFLFFVLSLLRMQRFMHEKQN